MPRKGPKLYGPIKPPEPPNMVWIIMDWKKNKPKQEQQEEKEVKRTPEVKMITKSMSSLSLDHKVKKEKPSFAQAIVSSLETRDVKPCNDGSHFKMLSSYDNDTRKLTVWSPTKPEKYISHLNRDIIKTTSCPSLASLLSDSASNLLRK